MICFPNAKINIGLNITEKRDDGYHNIESIFYPIPLCDALEIVIANEQQSPGFFTTGIDIPGLPDNNLCVKAYNSLKEKFNLPEVAIHLHKVIPMGAGLGGGSSDGAFALKLLNDLFHLNMGQQELHGYALQLGSDCPFFIQNESKYVTGRGEQMQNTELDLSGWNLVIIHPGIHVSTQDAYSDIVPEPSGSSLQLDVVYNTPKEWEGKIRNKFEASVYKKHPEIEELKEELYKNGAAYAAMTGSGSAVFGLFEKHVEGLASIFPTNFSWQGTL